MEPLNAAQKTTAVLLTAYDNCDNSNPTPGVSVTLSCFNPCSPAVPRLPCTSEVYDPKGVPLDQRQDCIGQAGGDKTTCLNTPGCSYDNTPDVAQAPWCFKSSGWVTTAPCCSEGMECTASIPGCVEPEAHSPFQWKRDIREGLGERSRRGWTI